MRFSIAITLLSTIACSAKTTVTAQVDASNETTCDPRACDPGYECIDNGKNTRAYCRKPCKSKADCASDETCYVPTNVELVPYCSLDRTGSTDPDAGITVVHDAGLSDSGKKDAAIDAGTFCAALNNVTFDAHDGTCDTCMGNSCCSQVTACFGKTSNECALLYRCVVDCNDDQACEDQCKSLVSLTGYNEFNSVISCLRSKCGSACT